MKFSQRTTQFQSNATKIIEFTIVTHTFCNKFTYLNFWSEIFYGFPYAFIRQQKIFHS